MKLVLVPGLACDETVWRSQVDALADLLPTLVAGAHSPQCMGLDSIEAMASALLEALPGVLLLAGHSLGGRIALEMVRQAPTRICALALLSSGYQKLSTDIAGEHEIAARQALLQIARWQGMRAMGLAWLPRMLHPDRRGEEALVQPLLQMIERCPLSRYECQVRALIARPDASDVLRHLSCSALMLSGEEDSWSPLSAHEQMAQIAPGSMWVGIPRCGHMATVEQPHAVSAALRAWLLRAL